MIDVVVGGVLKRKTHDEVYKSLEKMAVNNCQWPLDCSMPRKPNGLYEIDAIIALTAQIALLTTLIAKFYQNSSVV